MLRPIIYIISLYFLYKFIFEFLVPLFRTTSKIQQDMRSMHQRMEEQMKSRQQQEKPAPKPEPPEASHEYIDFEEVKK